MLGNPPLNFSVACVWGVGMSLFVRFNRKSIDDRQIDTLIGLSRGILADGKVSQVEAEVLLNWLVQNRQSTENPIILNLLDRVSAMLEDGVLHPEESQELFQLLGKITGEPSELGELAKSTSLPLDDPAPKVSFEGSVFLFTGTCAYGTRRECQEVIESLGGVNASSVTKTLDYLVLGTYVTDSCIHETFGRKIEKALNYREDGIPLAIISEEHWARAEKLL